MLKTVSSTAPGQAVSGGNGICRQAGRDASSCVSAGAAPAPAGRAVLVVRSMRRGLDIGARAEPGNRAGGLATAVGGRECGAGGRVSRVRVKSVKEERKSSTLLSAGIRFGLLDVMWGPVLSFACPDDFHADTASRYHVSTTPIAAIPAFVVDETLQLNPARDGSRPIQNNQAAVDPAR